MRCSRISWNITFKTALMDMKDTKDLKDTKDRKDVQYFKDMKDSKDAKVILVLSIRVCIHTFEPNAAIRTHKIKFVVIVGDRGTKLCHVLKPDTQFRSLVIT